jgi:hypothetical protein
MQSIDATGWQASETETQMLIEDGTIQFFCNGATLRFGKNVASWDAEKIIQKIEAFAQNDLSTDDKTELMLRQLYKNNSNN